MNYEDYRIYHVMNAHGFSFLNGIQKNNGEMSYNHIIFNNNRDDNRRILCYN